MKNTNRKEQVKPSTANRELDTFRNMLNMAVTWEMLDESPYKGVRHFKVNNGNLRILSDEEFNKLFQTASTDLKPILLTAIYTGMRRGEILNLKWEDVNLPEEYLIVRDSKNYDSRVISLNHVLLRTLKDLNKKAKTDFVFEGRKTIKRAWEKTLKNSEIKHCRFHDLRHTFASRLVMNGVDLITVAELMGHKDLSMTKRYAHPTPQHKKKAVNNLNFDLVTANVDIKMKIIK